MSDLADLTADMTKDFPSHIRRILDTALVNGWELNPPGMTLALRLNHPTDPLADPVYVVWTVGRTPVGRMSYRFSSAGTRGLVPLSGADLLVYLGDPTVAYPVTEELEAGLEARTKPPEWDRHAPPEVNLMRQLQGTLIAVEPNHSPPPVRRRQSVDARPLRVKLPAPENQASQLF